MSDQKHNNLSSPDYILDHFPQEVIVPIIHNNGTSAKELVENIRNLYCSLTTTIQHLRTTAPHQRDYYVSPDPKLFEKAVHQYRRYFLVLECIQEQVQKIAMEIQKQERKKPE